jgi:hypothetical protein
VDGRTAFGKRELDAIEVARHDHVSGRFACPGPHLNGSASLVT